MSFKGISRKTGRRFSVFPVFLSLKSILPYWVKGFYLPEGFLVSSDLDSIGLVLLILAQSVSIDTFQQIVIILAMANQIQKSNNWNRPADNRLQDALILDVQDYERVVFEMAFTNLVVFHLAVQLVFENLFYFSRTSFSSKLCRLRRDLSSWIAKSWKFVFWDKTAKTLFIYLGWLFN